MLTYGIFTISLVKLTITQEFNNLPSHPASKLWNQCSKPDRLTLYPLPLNIIHKAHESDYNPLSLQTDVFPVASHPFSP